jgi:(S)-ureidoglycine aminohydrolase
MSYSYYTPRGGLPGQDESHYDPARFTTAYALIPGACLSDIVTSALPGWSHARAWILARPLSGFAETFAQLIVEMAPGGAAPTPEPNPRGEGVIFVTDGVLSLRVEGADHRLTPGGYAYIPPGCDWSLSNDSDQNVSFHWIRRRYIAAPDTAAPQPLITHDNLVKPVAMPGTDGKWATTRFVDPSDMRHDMHVNIVTFQPGGRIPFAETHVMEHGLFVLQGRGRYLLNTDWVEVGPGDFMWLRAFCPQACEAIGDEPFRYLLYKDVNRHPKLGLV